MSTADFDGDGWIDIYVANDGEDNLLWLNQKNGTFKEVALTAGAAVTAEGKAEASMGVDAGDFDNDGDDDLLMTELTGQGFNLYVNDGSARFRDQGAMSGLGPASTQFTGWGTAWFDYDNDGWLDTFSANGTIITLEGHEKVAFPYDQHRLLFRNLGNGRFEDVTAKAGASFTMSESGRGAAFGDVDNDGDIDILVGNDAGRARLLINNVGNRRHWIGLRLVGDRTPRDMLGARVGVTRSQTDTTLWRRVRADGSYASANDPRVLVGLGDSATDPRVQVRWPDGRSEEWSSVAVDRWSDAEAGRGQVTAHPRAVIGRAGARVTGCRRVLVSEQRLDRVVFTGRRTALCPAPRRCQTSRSSCRVCRRRSPRSRTCSRARWRIRASTRHRARRTRTVSWPGC